MNDRIAAIIVAAGSASRYGSDKIIETIAGKPVLVHSVETFTACARVRHITVVTHPDLITSVRQLVNRYPAVAVVAGGETRQESVARGLNALPEAEFVLVHDGARPVVSLELIDATIDALEAGADAAITAIPIVDTVKRVTGDGVETVDRTALFRAQTPQGFRLDLLNALMERGRVEGVSFTDESALFEYYGADVKLIPGDERNLKLTVPADRPLIEALLTQPEEPVVTRSGIGYDVHRFVDGRPLVLGGVDIPHSHGLLGHSDADVLLHALADALLGACALGDIGQHFPPTDERFRNISSLILLERAGELVREHGSSVVHCDVMVVAEEPKIGPYVPLMRERIAEALRISTGSVSIKATTNEGMGFVGRGEGIAALATVTVAGAR